MYVAGSDGLMRPTHAIPNSWGGAPRVWRTLRERYLPALVTADNIPLIFDLDAARKVWELVHAPQLQVFEKITLGTTFDRCCITTPYFTAAAEALESFAIAHPVEDASACSLMNQATYLRSLPPSIQAVGWQQTTVSPDQWVIYDPATEEARPYDLVTGTEHFYLFDLLPELRCG